MSKITSLQIYDKPILLQAAKSEPYFQGPDLLYDNNNNLATEGWVYRISDKYVVKVAARRRYKKGMFYEIKIARLLYSLGISVPEPITCDYVNVRDKVEIGYIMEYIDGITNEHSCHSQVLDEVNKANELGFIYTDSSTIVGSSPGWIFTKDKKIKLIDFTKWKYKGL